jgi:hypothetical protein
MAQVSNDVVNGVKLRGDGSVDDTQPGAVGAPRRAGLDDIGADGLKRRGDGSIDDNQPGLGRGPMEDRSRRERFIEDGKRIERRYDADGTLIRERSRPDRGPGERIERRFNGDGELIRERIQSGNSGRGSDRSDSLVHGDRLDRVERSERAERSERTERDNNGYGGRN